MATLSTYSDDEADGPIILSIPLMAVVNRVTLETDPCDTPFSCG
jgi:hypothetical protein